MIKAKNIYKSYGDLQVLKGVNLNIDEGEIVSIVGESGAGKSTLLQILGTLDLPTDAQKHGTEITIAGEPFLKMNDQELSKFRNENIGFVFQHHQLLFDLRDRYNQTFVIITHNPILAESADRKLVMKDGIIL